MKNKEIRIGILIVLFIIFSLFFMIWIKGDPFKNTYELQVLFKNVHGLRKGSIVEYQGLKCGQIKNFKVLDNGIITYIKIDEPSIKIYKKDRFIIIPNSTIASEFLIFIEKSKEDSKLINKKDLIIGEEMPAFQDFMEGAQKTLNNVNDFVLELSATLKSAKISIKKVDLILDNVNALIKDESIKKTILNLSNSSESLNESIITINKILNKTEGKLDAISEQEIRAALKNLNVSLENIRKMTDSIDKADFQKIKNIINETEEIMLELNSKDPNENSIKLLKKNLKRIDRISTSLEKNLRQKSLIKNLFSKMAIPPAEQ